MAEFDNGVGVEDVQADDFVSDDIGVEDAGAEGVSPDVETDDGADNPWSWVEEEGVDPNVVRDSFKNYTKKTQELANERRELEPYRELMGALQEDAGLQKIIREYYANGETPEKAIGNLEQELRTMQTKIALDEEFSALRNLVSEKGLPDFKNDEVLEYAVDNNIGSMEAAYKAMKFEEAQSAARAKLEGDIKKGRVATPPKSGRGDSAGSGRPSIGDIAGMSEEEFLSGYGGLVKSIVG